MVSVVMKVPTSGQCGSLTLMSMSSAAGLTEDREHARISERTIESAISDMLRNYSRAVPAMVVVQ